MSERSDGIVQITVVTVPAGDAELAADRLMTAGAFAVEERPAGERVELRGRLGDDLATVAHRLGTLPGGWSLRIDPVDATPSEAWREYASAVRVTHDLALRPAWVAPMGEPDLLEVAIEPASAFGLGDHPTTRLSAAAVRRVTRPGDRVLDVGCGTGVLAIVALLSGATSAVAIDVADVAVTATLANADRNGVAGRLEVSTQPLEQVEGAFELVVANILAPALVALADDLRRVTAPAGRLIVSGVLADRHDHVLAALAPMQVVAADVLDGWAAVELRHAV